MDAWHVTMRLEEDAVLARDITARRVLARTILRLLAGRGLLSFGLADTHLHQTLIGPREEVGRNVRDVEAALRRRLSLPPFQPARFHRIRDVWHLDEAFGYALKQAERHGVGGDPYREGTSLPDLMGLRLVGNATIADVRTWLPRVDRVRLLQIWGLQDLEPGRNLDALADSAAAAACLPDLRGRDDAYVSARRAAFVAGRTCGEPVSRLAERLEIPRRTATHTLSGPADPLLVRAVLLQMGLRERIRPETGAFSGEQQSAGLAARTPECCPGVSNNGHVSRREPRNVAQR